MKRFEYEIFVREERLAYNPPIETDNYLNKKGLDGWRLVNVVKVAKGVFHYVLMREIDITGNNN